MMTKKAIFFLFVFLSYIPVLAQVDTAWGRRYNGPGNGDDQASALAVDDSGNVYVTGYSADSSSYPFYYDYATIKYDSNGDTLWVRRYNGPGNGDDRASALAVDNSGNVYVTGHSTGEGSYFDYATIKYNSNGDSLWVRRYNGPGNSDDAASALVVDSSGNVYVNGTSSGSGTYFDYATIKYNSSGDTLWVRRFNGPGNAFDHASGLAVDGSGNVYVTGTSVGSGAYQYDYTTIKYNSNGDSLWVRRYNELGDSDEIAYALAVDGSGNVYVTGESWVYGTAALQDYATIKYNSNGDTLWVRRYNGPGNTRDIPTALTVDSSGNVYVTGASSKDTPTDDLIGDYTTIKYAPYGDTLWVRSYKGPGNSDDFTTGLATDGNGNVYVTGTSVGSGTYNYDYATIKYNSNGDTLWVRRYNGPGNDWDKAYALAVDDSENVYVAGYSSRGPSYDIGTLYDYTTIKYNKFGCAAWVGDANGNFIVDLSDIIFEVNHIFRGRPKPDPFCAGDANADGKVLLPDIIYLINFIFKSGPAPQKSRECCL